MRAEFKYGGIFLVVILVILGLRVFAGESDERQIDRQLRTLVEAASVREGESRLQALSAGRRLMDFFGTDAVVEYLPGRSFPVREEAVVGARSQMTRGTFRASGHSVSVSQPGKTAQSVVTIAADVAAMGESGKGSHRYALDWMKVDGEWRIIQVTYLE